MAALERLDDAKPGPWRRMRCWTGSEAVVKLAEGWGEVE